MPNRTFAGIAAQIGAESTIGVTAPANRQLMGFTIDPSPSFETQQIRASGNKLVQANIVTSEKTEASWSSNLDYEGIVYPLSSILGAPTITPDDEETPTNYEWVWEYTGAGSVTPKTYTVESGDAQGAFRFNHAAFTSADLTFAKNAENQMSGNMVGRAMESGVTLTATPTQIDPVPAIGKHLDVFVDSSHEDLGTTKHEELFEANLNMGDVLAEVYTINSTYTSFTTLINSAEPSFEWGMTIGVDPSYLNKIRIGDRQYVRLIANGGANHRIEIDMCVGITNIDGFQDTQNVYAMALTFGLMPSKEWGKAMEIRVTNTLPSL